MRKEVNYIAIDGSLFSTEKECMDYENSIWKDEIEKNYKKIQRLKSGDLEEAFKQFKKAKQSYKEACTTKMSQEKRIRIISSYLNKKTRYEEEVAILQKCRNRIDFLKKTFEKKN